MLLQLAHTTGLIRRVPVMMDATEEVVLRLFGGCGGGHRLRQLTLQVE